MGKMILKGALSLAAAALVTAEPASAAMSCWKPEETAAAKIRDLQSKLMVATLQCRAIGIDVLASYNDFVKVNRTTLQEANGVIKAQFARGYGKEAQNFYDRFTTALANEYGAVPTDGQSCEDTAEAAAEAAAAGGDVQRLIDLADRLGGSPQLPGGVCPVTLSAR